MTLEPIARAWSPIPLPYKAAIIGGILVLVLVVSGGVGGLVSKWKDARFDKAEAARQVERDKETMLRDAAIKRAEAAEAQAAVLEEQAAALKKLASQAGQTANERAEKAREIENATQDAVERAGADPATARAEYREALRRLGYLPR